MSHSVVISVPTPYPPPQGKKHLQSYMGSNFFRSLLLVNVVWIMTDFTSVQQMCKRSI